MCREIISQGPKNKQRHTHLGNKYNSFQTTNVRILVNDSFTRLTTYCHDTLRSQYVSVTRFNRMPLHHMHNAYWGNNSSGRVSERRPVFVSICLILLLNFLLYLKLLNWILKIHFIFYAIFYFTHCSTFHTCSKYTLPKQKPNWKLIKLCQIGIFVIRQSDTFFFKCIL